MQKLHLENSWADMLILHNDSNAPVDILNGGEKWEEGRRWGGFSIVFIRRHKNSLDDSKNFTAKKKKIYFETTLHFHYFGSKIVF